MVNLHKKQTTKILCKSFSINKIKNNQSALKKKKRNKKVHENKLDNELKRSLKCTSINTQKLFRVDIKQKRNHTHKKKNRHTLIAKK